MNAERLQTIFRNYVEKYDLMNAPDPGGNETFKWEAAFDFKNRMDDMLASPPDNLYEKMSDTIGNTSVLLNNHFEWPGTALAEYCKTDAKEIQTLLRSLFSEDGGDLYKRQERINDFVTGCERLRVKNFPESFRYEIGQRAAMVLLGLYDPEQNYIYKASQAKEFADCVEFPEDWGTYGSFRLSIYYKMCDQLVSYIKKDSVLMATHRKRYQQSEHRVHPDKNLHLLAFDVIYCCTVYHLMDNINYSHISYAEKKQYHENKKKAQALVEELTAKEEEMELFRDAEAFFKPFLAVGSSVKHKVFGQGTVTVYSSEEDHCVTVRFASVGEKKLEAEMSVIKGFLTVEAPELAERKEKYKPLLSKNRQQLAQTIQRTEQALAPLREYLD